MLKAFIVSAPCRSARPCKAGGMVIADIDLVAGEVGEA